MNENLVMVKATMTAFFSAAGMFLGWRVILLLVLLALMALDFLSGSLAARQKGTWKSSMAREGIGHKAGMALIVVVCVIADFVLLLAIENLPHDVVQFHWPMAIFPLVTVWYILTEIGSIIENAMEMGAKVPAWLPKLLNATLKVVDNVGEDALGEHIVHENSEDAGDPYALMGFDHDEGAVSGLIEEE